MSDSTADSDKSGNDAPLPPQGAPFNHDKHGQVRVVCVADGVVYFDVVGETIHGTDQPLVGRQPREAFEIATEPAEQTATCPPAQIDTTEPTP